MSISESKILWFVSIVTVYANGSWLQFDYNILVKVVLLLIVFAFVLLKGKEQRLSLPNFLIVFLLVFPVLSTYIVNFSANVNVVNIIFTSFLLLMYASLPLEYLYKILDKYCRIIFFLVCIAIPAGIFFLIFPDVLELAPKVYSPFFDHEGGYWYNLVVFTERSITDFRVQSIFWEPGAWAYNQMIAFYYLIFIKQEYKKIPVFLLSILLTLSTSGLLACLLCLLVLIRKFNKKTLVVGLAAFILIAGIVSYIIFSNEILAEIFYQNTLGKFSSDSVSLEDRSSAAANAFNIANQNWLFGIGRQNNESYVYVTSCISEISYQLGYLYLVVYVITFFQFFNKLGILIGSLFCLILMNSEAYSFYPLNLFLIALGSKVILMRRNYVSSERELALNS